MKPATPETIFELSKELEAEVVGSGQELETVNRKTRILAINAQIESARAGEAGRAFSVVGREIAELSTQTAGAASRLMNRTRELARELGAISTQLGTEVRGTRLVDLAFTNIDLIDRNLYERSCDCRWWATDAAFVAALESGSGDALAFASTRMGVILKAYTVYFDIVLADRDGRIVANGRPREYASVGSHHEKAAWFRSAMATAHGDEFGFQSAHVTPLAGGERALVYSCKVCRGGDARGEPLGVLGVVFRWDALADQIVRNTPMEPQDRARTRVLIADREGMVLADTNGKALVDRLPLGALAAVLSRAKGYAVSDFGGRSFLVAHAKSAGFETYSTGWHSLILRSLDVSARPAA